MGKQKRAVALGFFDGIHRGHAALMRRTAEVADENSYHPSVVSFDVHPDVLVTGHSVNLINSAEERQLLVRELFGIEEVVLLHFNRDMLTMPWQKFAEVLIKDLNIGWIVVGHDFTFGNRAEGTAEKMQNYCKHVGIGCDIIPAVKIENTVVSSTYIRSLIQDGEMERANRFLGHPHILVGRVETGYHLGTKMGTPTINLPFPQGIVVPRKGVYATKVELQNGGGYHAVSNIGVRPTVSTENRLNIESFLLNFSGNLYGEYVKISFYKYLRPERKFPDTKQLASQIHKDAAEADTVLQEEEEKELSEL